MADISVRFPPPPSSARRIRSGPTRSTDHAANLPSAGRKPQPPGRTPPPSRPIARRSSVVRWPALRSIGAPSFARGRGHMLIGGGSPTPNLSPRSSRASPRRAIVCAIIAEASQRFGIPASWIRAVMRAESLGDVRALSPKGAMGLMQIMPETWAGSAFPLRPRRGSIRCARQHPGGCGVSAGTASIATVRPDFLPPTTPVRRATKTTSRQVGRCPRRRGLTSPLSPR